MPPDTVTGRSLTLVISIMCFLACLTAGAVYMINQSASAWLKDIASEVTAQVEPRDGLDTEKTVRDAEAFLREQQGHRPRQRARASRLPPSCSSPGSATPTSSPRCPVPRLIAVEVDRSDPARYRGHCAPS